jgi:hypothetical protein
MPFTPPATYASQANDAYLATFYIGTVASPDSYNVILEIKSFNPDFGTVPEVPTTHLLSPFATEEFSPGLIKPGKVEVTANLIFDTSQQGLTPLMQGQVIFFWKIVAPVQRKTKTYTATGTGFLVSYKPGPFENNKAIDLMFGVQITGVYVETLT